MFEPIIDALECLQSDVLEFPRAGHASTLALTSQSLSGDKRKRVELSRKTSGGVDRLETLFFAKPHNGSHLRAHAVRVLVYGVHHASHCMPARRRVERVLGIS